jgi:serine phosphatase RsbU (regulator of sigma subunit)
MVFDTIHIILGAIIVILLMVLLMAMMRIKQANAKAGKKIGRAVAKFEKDKLYLEKEIKRQQFIIEDYKQKNPQKQPIGSNSDQSATKSGPRPDQGTDAQGTNSGSPEYNFLEFKEKNKKLWELSIAVHKEKERIDMLRKVIEHRHNEVTQSITYAQRIQKALLPTSKILGIRFSDYFIFFKPKDIVSGDFYWFKRLEDSIVIAVADCTGHGVPGAFMSLLGISFLNDIYNKDPKLASNQVLDRLREMIKLALHQDLDDKRVASDGMDMALCIINNKTLEMDFTGANNPMYLIRNGDLKIFEPNRNPIGVHPSESPFKNQIFQLMKNDKIYLFSDGFIDQFGGESRRKFLKKNFQKLVQYIAECNLTMQEEHNVFEKTFQRWKGDSQPQIDDLLVMGIKI